MSVANARSPDGNSYVDLYWIPLGAGGHVVGLNGKVFEAIVALKERRRPLDLYHSALVVKSSARTFVIEVTPVPRTCGTDRGVVGGGPVGSRLVGALRVFRYEVHCWEGGVIPDVAEAVESPRRLTDDPAIVDGLLKLVPLVPTPVWGRDELRAGDMWNSNSVVSWLTERAGLGAGPVSLPVGGRAPGWDAGRVVAHRQTSMSSAPA